MLAHAWGANDLSFASAVWARTHHAKETLLVLRLTAAATGYASFGMSSFFGSRAVTLHTFFQARDAELFVLTIRRVFKRYLEIVTKIRTALYGCSSPATRAEHITEAKEIEDILNIREAGIKSSAADSAMACLAETAKRGMLPLQEISFNA